MQLNDGTDRSVGDLSFKGLNPNGMIEIGYGIKKEFEGQGYMTEAMTHQISICSCPLVCICENIPKGYLGSVSSVGE